MSREAWDRWYDALRDYARSHAQALVPKWIPGGRQNGNEYQPLNPRRADTKPGSFTINVLTGAWCDFALTDTGGGDLISLYGYIKGLDYAHAATALAEEIGFPTTPAAQYPKQTAQAQQEAPPPAEEPEEAQPTTPWPTHPKLGRAEEEYIYRDESGEPHHGIAVYRKRRRKKMIVQYDFARGVWKAPERRVLYNLPAITTRLNASVFIVEGEKCAVALIKKLADEMGETNPYVVSTWSSGTSAIKKTDWRPLKGRKVCIIPDDDLTGRKAALDLMGHLHQLQCVVRVADMFHFEGDGYDIADAAQKRWSFTDAFRGAMARADSQPDEFKKAVQVLQRQAAGAEITPDLMPVEPVQEDTEVFWPLGYSPTGDGSVVYHVMSIRRNRMGTGIIHTYTASSLTPANLLSLADQAYWEARYGWGKRASGGGHKGKVDWHVVANAIIMACHSKGPIDIEKARRGRGVWKRPSDGKVVVHPGEQVYVDGKWSSVWEICEPDFFPEVMNNIPLRAPKVAKEEMRELANLFLRACRSLPWQGEETIYGDLLAGWCVMAPFAGALAWRPHILLQGPAESGKTTILKNLVERSTAPWAATSEGSTTAAGLRRAGPRDAIPILFDEAADQKDRRSTQRWEEIRHLLRAASSESGGIIRHGDGRSYRIRSMFCFASINPQIEDAADRSRITVLPLEGHSSAFLSSEKLKTRSQEWANTWAMIDSLPDRWGTELFWMSYDARIEIGKRRRLFRASLMENLQEARLADQLSPMLAGASMLEHPGEGISMIDVMNYIGRVNAELSGGATELDHHQLLVYLLSCDVNIVVDGKVAAMTIGSAIDVIWEAEEDDPEGQIWDRMKADAARARLKECGFHIHSQEKALYIANTSAFISRALQNTRWPEGWGRSLMAIKGARTTNAYSFSRRAKSRATSIPMDVIHSELRA